MRDYKNLDEWADGPYPLGLMTLLLGCSVALFLLAGFGTYHLFFEEHRYLPSDVKVQDLRGAAKYQARGMLR